MHAPEEKPSGDAVGAGTLPFEVLVLTLPGTTEPVSQIAVRADAVREVARTDRITPYPGAPADVAGVTAVRGRIVAVLDLVARFGAGPGSTLGDASSTLVLLDVGDGAIALAGATPVRVIACGLLSDGREADSSSIALWSGRLLPLAGRVRLLDASRPDASDGAVCPLLDAAALIDDVIDDPDGGR